MTVPLRLSDNVKRYLVLSDQSRRDIFHRCRSDLNAKRQLLTDDSRFLSAADLAEARGTFLEVK
jgi:hypothetical protein